MDIASRSLVREQYLGRLIWSRGLVDWAIGVIKYGTRLMSVHLNQRYTLHGEWDTGLRCHPFLARHCERQSINKNEDNYPQS